MTPICNNCMCVENICTAVTTDGDDLLCATCFTPLNTDPLAKPIPYDTDGPAKVRVQPLMSPAAQIPVTCAS